MDHERILYIYEMLIKHTNADKGITIKDIQSYLSKNTHMKNVSALTIRRDIERLITTGNDIEATAGPHNTAYYKLKNKGFTFNEIRFIVDSVSINKFLSDAQKQHMIKKFESMCSEEEVRQLISRISLNSKKHRDFSDLLENLENVHYIISERCKINFEYGKYKPNHTVVFEKKPRNIIPLVVVYFNERFYLKCWNLDDDNLRTYRIDRMKNIEKGESLSKKLSMPEYSGTVVDIFEPEYFEKVTLRLNKILLDEMYEQFGSNIHTLNDSNDSDFIIIRTEIGISEGFYKWIMKYGRDIELLGPPDLRKEFKKRLKPMYELYNDIR